MVEKIHVKAFEDIVTDATSNYPSHLRSNVAGRVKRRLGKAVGLRAFSVVLIDLPPGAAASLKMRQSHEDYFYMTLEGVATLVTDEGEEPIRVGECAGFAAGHASAHCVTNKTQQPVTVLEVASLAAQNVTTYPEHDLLQVPSASGRRFVRQDGSSY